MNVNIIYQVKEERRKVKNFLLEFYFNQEPKTMLSDKKVT
jgi:hypothetical protein